MARYDWATIKAEYETGLYSMRELAEKHGFNEKYALRKAGKDNWEKGKDFSHHFKDIQKSFIMQEKADILKTLKNFYEDNMIDDEFIINKTELRLKGFYVYRFLNSSGKVIYIGRTSDLTNRMDNTHFSENGHLPQECYNEVKDIQVARCNNKDEMKIYELYLINKLMPKWNIKDKHNSIFRFKLPDLKWYGYEGYKKIERYCQLSIYDLLE